MQPSCTSPASSEPYYFVIPFPAPTFFVLGFSPSPKGGSFSQMIMLHVVPGVILLTFPFSAVGTEDESREGCTEEVSAGVAVGTLLL